MIDNLSMSEISVSKLSMTGLFIAHNHGGWMLTNFHLGKGCKK